MILELVGGRKQIPGLPSWCPDLAERAYRPTFCVWHRAGIPDGPMTNNLFHAKTTTTDNNLDISGFRMDTISECEESEYPGTLLEHMRQPVTWARKYIRWEAQLLALAQKITMEVLPVEHAVTLMGHTRRRMPNVEEKDLLQAYQSHLVDVQDIALDRASIARPGEPIELLQRTTVDIAGTCAHRHYFSTENGRLGLGPLDIKKGDTVCALYGTRPFIFCVKLR
jgi:hypothetical protein